MTIGDKACPVVLRHRPDGDDLLVFRHPLRGIRLIHGSVAANERPGRSAQRELFESAGVPTSGEGRMLGQDEQVESGYLWHFVLCSVAALPDSWTFQTHELGGHQLAFRWHCLGAAMSDADWDPISRRATITISRLLAASTWRH